MMRTALAVVFLVASAARSAEPLVITHVNVIDVAARSDSTALLRDRTIIIADGRIRAVAKGVNVKVPRRARVIDGSGKFLIDKNLGKVAIPWSCASHTVAIAPRISIRTSGLLSARRAAIPTLRQDPLESREREGGPA